MQAWKSWNKLFNRKHLIQHYNEKIKSHPSVRLDKITLSNFSENLDNNITTILNKVEKQTYKFTRYKQILFSKGAGKPPRCVSIPTIRDKLTISTLNELLQNVYGKQCVTPMPQIVIEDISDNINNYSYFIKIDISTFFASINQEILLKKIKEKIRKPQIISLIKNAIQTNTIPCTIQNRSKLTPKTDGIPEGLAISNSLANLYMSSIDEKYKANAKIRYWRYVDDILLFVNPEDFNNIREQIFDDISKLKLKINEKKDEGKICDGFTYLGYKISSSIISVRESSILKMEQSLERLFYEIKPKKNLEYIQWKVNLKITGFISNKHKYGWLFFYSQITDISLLYHLDNLIKKFRERYNILDSIKFKRFVRAYHEIRQALNSTNYVPDIDLYNLDKKKDILKNIYGENIDMLSEIEINIRFNRIIAREIQDIEKDVQDIS